MAQFELSISIMDVYQRRGSKRFLLEALDIATAITNAGLFATSLADVMEAEILNYSVAARVAYTDTVGANANLDEGITISCDLGAGKRAALKIPSPKNSVLNGDGTVDLTDAAITALESHYLSGDVLISDGEIVLDFLSGKLDR